jgi:hypothetical protein
MTKAIVERAGTDLLQADEYWRGCRFAPFPGKPKNESALDWHYPICGWGNRHYNKIDTL